MRGNKKNIKLKLLQGKGKVRRFVYIKARKKYVEKQTSIRNGECKRCGNCCMFIFKCPFLKTRDEVIACRIYGKRPKQCQIFPLDNKDFKELPTPCGYYFEACEDELKEA